MISMNEVKWLAERAHALYGEGFLGFYGHEEMPTVHMAYNAFLELFEGKDIVRDTDYTDDYNKLIYIVDGVWFMCLEVKEIGYEKGNIDA